MKSVLKKSKKLQSFENKTKFLDGRFGTPTLLTITNSELDINDNLDFSKAGRIGIGTENPTEKQIKNIEEQNDFQAKFENMNTSDWSIINGKLQKIFTLDDFQKSIYFVNKIAKLAEEENHHPEINIDHNTVIK